MTMPPTTTRSTKSARSAFKGPSHARLLGSLYFPKASSYPEVSVRAVAKRTRASSFAHVLRERPWHPLWRRAPGRPAAARVPTDNSDVDTHRRLGAFWDGG